MYYKIPSTTILPQHFTYIVFGIIFLSLVSLVQGQTISYKGKDITPAEFCRLTYPNRVNILINIYKNSTTTDAFLTPQSAADLDSMMAIAQKRIRLAEEKGSGNGFSPEVVKNYIEQMREIIRIMLDRQFKNRDLEGKLSLMAFLADQPEFFNKFYAMLTPSEKDSALIVVDKMIPDTKKHAAALNLSQDAIDQEVSYYIALKKKLLSLQTKK